MAYASKLPAFTLLEIVLVLVVLGVLGTLVMPKVLLTQETLCHKRLADTLKLIDSSLTQFQIQAFLINDFQASPHLSTLSQPFLFSQRNCALFEDKDTLVFQSGNSYATVSIQKIADQYQLVCAGAICPLLKT